jgi:hypothetical protein
MTKHFIQHIGKTKNQCFIFYCTAEMGGGVLWLNGWVRLGKKYGF